MLKVVPALLAGCPVILKPSPLSPLDPFYLSSALTEAGLPHGMISILPGDAELGDAMVRHTGIDMVTFTGSSPTGRAIAAAAGAGLKKSVLECGGKSAAIVLEDVELQPTVSTIAAATFTNTGQYCRALSRVLVPESRYDELVEAMVAAASNIQVGDPFDPTTTMGPLASASQRERVEGYIRLAREEGAQLAYGGKRPPALSRGWYLEPTVFVGVTNEMRIAQEEVFGPVMCVIPYRDVAEAITLANTSEFGLAAAVFTTDELHGLEVAMHLEAGLIGINTQGARECVSCPGLKASGLGDEHGPEGYREFLEARSIVITEGIANELDEPGVPGWGPETVAGPDRGTRGGL